MDKPKPIPNDVIVPGPEIEPGRRAVIRLTPQGVSAGEVVDITDKSAEEIKALGDGEMVHAQRIEGTPAFAVHSIAECAAKGHSGPAQVASPDYRDGWDRIFGGKHEVGKA